MAAKTYMKLWLHRSLLLVVLVGSFISFRLLWNGYDNYRAKREYAERVRDAQDFLEASNPARRRAGLWAITAAFCERTYAQGYHGSSVTTVKLSDPNHGYQPRPTVKLVGYDTQRRQLLWEKETIYFTIIQSNDSLNYALRRAFSYQAAQATAQGRNAWGIDSWTNELTRSTANTERSFLLTRAQADSVLRDWRARGVRDSLAALAKSRQ